MSFPFRDDYEKREADKKFHEHMNWAIRKTMKELGFVEK